MLLASLRHIKFLKDGICPSHLIITNVESRYNYSDRCGTEDEEVCIYFISEKQKGKISKARLDLMSNSIPVFNL